MGESGGARRGESSPAEPFHEHSEGLVYQVWPYSCLSLDSETFGFFCTGSPSSAGIRPRGRNIKMVAVVFFPLKLISYLFIFTNPGKKSQGNQGSLFRG